MPLSTDRLTLKQTKFVNAYIETNGNATQSAQIAGYSNQSNGVLRSIAAENLTKPNVQQAITKKLQSVMDSEEVLETFTTYARHTPKLIKASDSLKALEMLAKVHKLVDDSPKNTEVNVQIIIGSINKEVTDRIKLAKAYPDEYEMPDAQGIRDKVAEYCGEYDESELTCLALLDETLD